MTQQPFTRRGAIDLSALKRPATPPPGAGQAPGGAPAGGGGSAAGAYTVAVTAQTLPQVAEASMTAPVLLVVYSRVTLARERDVRRRRRGARRAVRRPVPGRAGRPRHLARGRSGAAGPAGPGAAPAGRRPPRDAADPRVDPGRRAQRDAQPGRPAAHHPGRHRPPPAAGAAPAAGEGDDGAVADPRYAAAEDALARDDIDTAVLEYQSLVDANPADHEAAAGPGDGQGPAAHRRRRPRRRAGRGRRRARRRRRPDPGRRPRPVRGAGRGGLRPAGRAGPGHRRQGARPAPAST